MTTPTDEADSGETIVRTEPKPTVKLVGEDGNAFAIIGACQRALRRAGCSAAHIDAFRKEAMSGDYDNVLQTAMKYCEVE
jgi:hypothetical protein